MTNSNRVSVFFYGGYMSFDVLTNLGIGEREYDIGQMPGYALTIGGSANVVKNGLESVYGIVTQLTHAEIDTLYGSDAQAKLGAHYLPEPVLVMTADGDLVPALCYVAYEPVDGVAPAAYIDTILSAARQYDFPQSYIHHIESHR